MRHHHIGCSYKYNVTERNIARKIYQLLQRQKEAEKRYRELDVQIALLKNELRGKYGPPHKA